MNHYLDKHKNVLAIALVISVAAQINIDAPKVAPGFVFAHRCNRFLICSIFCFFRLNILLCK